MATKDKAVKEWDDLTDAEKTAAAAEFDQEFIADTFHDLTPEERQEWERAKRRKAAFSAGELKDILGAPSRQVQHWLNVGIIPTIRQNKRRKKHARRAVIRDDVVLAWVLYWAHEAGFTLELIRHISGNLIALRKAIGGFTNVKPGHFLVVTREGVGTCYDPDAKDETELLKQQPTYLFAMNVYGLVKEVFGLLDAHERRQQAERN